MKLYRARLNPHRNGIGADRTFFTTSAVKAQKIRVMHKPEPVEISECRVPDRLTPADWIELLEMDTPGNQEGKTPVDFLTVIESE